MKIAVIGGTGNMGYGLVLRLALAGHELIIGSRDESRALEAAEKARNVTQKNSICGMKNSTAAALAQLVIIAVPSVGHFATVESLQSVLCDKDVLDITVPLAFKPLRYAPPAAGSNALETSRLLGENAHVAAGFHTISSTLLEIIDTPLCADTLIVGNNKELKSLVISLAGEIGLRAFDAGSLELSPVVESLTPMLIGMNKRYGSNHIGIKIEGV